MSNNIRAAEESLVISNLRPATRYTVQLTAHNAAGSRAVSGQVGLVLPCSTALLQYR